jgi:cytochrome c oxidase subunit I
MTTATYHEAPSHSGGGLAAWIFSVDHKRVGILYLIGSFAAFTAAACMALGIRLEQYAPGESGLINYFVLDFGKSMSTPDAYNSVLTFHGAVMILGFVIPGLTGFATNYLVPIMIGAKDVAFPRINSFSVWMYLCGVVLALMTLVIPDKADMMWTGYPPYSIKTAGNTMLYVFIVHIMGFSSILGAINFITTTVYMRAPGMGWNQMNMFVWASFLANVLQLVFLPFLATAVTLLFFDKYVGTGFFNPATGGDPILYENIFWLYSHPAVYVMFIPAAGLVFEIIATMAKKSIFNYKAAVYGGMLGITVLSGIVWAHHMYVTGIPNWFRLIMSFTTILISIPAGLIVISMWGTVYKGAITWNVAMRYAALTFLFVLGGGLTGIPLAEAGLTLHFARTIYVPAHFHMIMGLFAAYAIVASVYFWFPAMTGRTADTALAKLAFWLNAVGTQLTFWPLIIIGADGMPRRYWDYSVDTVGPRALGWESWHHVATYGAMINGVGLFLMVAGWVYAVFAGERVGRNPWGSKSLEWTHASYPIGPGNFDEDVVVTSDWTPYSYKK